MAGMIRFTDNVEDSKHNHINAGRVDFLPKLPLYIDTLEVTEINKEYTIPAGSKFTLFSAKGDVAFAVRANDAATFPDGDILDGTGSFINPAQFDLTGVTTLNFIAEPDETTYVSLAIYV